MIRKGRERTSTRNKKRATFVGAIFSVIASVAMLVAVAAPASAKTPETVGGGPTNAYAAPTKYSTMIGGYLPRTYVTMYCWVDTNSWAYGTNRWFKVGGVGFNPYSGRINWIQGYVSANRVFNQVRVGHCR